VEFDRRRLGEQNASATLWPPVIGVCGYSGSGKTTLIERLIPLLAREGLSVGVLKHDAHHLSVDTPGKDTDRFFRAGADVLAHDPIQTFIRWHVGARTDRLGDAVSLLGRTCDLVIVEGHKRSPVPKLWLLSAADVAPANGVPAVLEVLPPDAHRLERALATIHLLLATFHRDLPVKVGVLVGPHEPDDRAVSSCSVAKAGAGSASSVARQQEFAGELTDMARWLRSALAPFISLESGVALLGSRGASRFPPCVDEGDFFFPLPAVTEKRGAVASVAAAFRWAPGHRWLVLTQACLGSPSRVVGELLRGAGAGKWAVVSADMLCEGGTPSAGLYDPPMGVFFERALRQGEHFPSEVLVSAQGRVYRLGDTGPAGSPVPDRTPGATTEGGAPSLQAHRLV